MNDFLLGYLAMGFLCGALFFWRFWQRTFDALFRLFALAFAVLGFNQLALLEFGEDSEYRLHLFGIRLSAFLLILFAIYRKNQEPSSG